MVDLYKDGVSDEVEFDREIHGIESQLWTAASAEVTLVELSMTDFESLGQTWDSATPEERAELLGQNGRESLRGLQDGTALGVGPKGWVQAHL